MIVRAASAGEHLRVYEVARLSRYTRDFWNTRMFSGEDAYARGWVGAAFDGGRVDGFVCVRVRAREPVTSLYFLGVRPEAQGRGLGTALLGYARGLAPGNTVEIKVDRRNAAARRWWEARGFRATGVTAHAHVMRSD